MIEIGGLMLFRHRESLLLTALNDEQRAVLDEYQVAASAAPAVTEPLALGEDDADAECIEIPVPH